VTIEVEKVSLGELEAVAAATEVNPVYQQQLQTMIAADDVVLFAAKVDDRYEGRVSLWLAPADEELPRQRYPGVPFVNALHVNDTMRRKGIASKLLIELEKEASKRGKSQLAVGVEPDNPPARELYEKLGFKYEGSQYQSCWDEPTAEGDTKRVCVDTMLMIKDLM
jgi:GNAT superfamily N-acetyltransferase